MKVKIKATKMLDANATHLSLVDRAANRTPFHVVKQEKTMAGFLAALDLSKVFARKSETPAVEIVGVVTMKGEGLAAAKALIEGAGFKVAAPVEMEDGAVVFKQEGSTEGEATTLRISDDIALVVKGYTPHTMDIETADGVSFADQVAEAQSWPSLSSVIDSLGVSAIEIVAKAEDKEEAAEVVAKMFEEAAAYASSMINALPASVFKLEQACLAATVAEPAKKEEAKVEAKKDEKKDEKKGEVKKDETKVEAKVDDAKPVEAKKEEAKVDDKSADTKANSTEVDATKVVKALTVEEVSNIVSDKLGETIKLLTTKMESALCDLSKAVQKSVSEVRDEVENATKLAKKAEAAVKGAVVNGSDSDDRVTKSEMRGSSGGREIDTGYMTREQRRQSRQ